MGGEDLRLERQIEKWLRYLRTKQKEWSTVKIVYKRDPIPSIIKHNQHQQNHKILNLS